MITSNPRWLLCLCVLIVSLSFATANNDCSAAGGVCLTSLNGQCPTGDATFSLSPYVAGDADCQTTLGPTAVCCQVSTCGDVCGDGIQGPTEECDNGILNSDSNPDACRTTCVNAFCGDNTIDAGEQCDDGNIVDGDGCSATCQTELPATFCGDGVPQALNDDGVAEQCDDGNLIPDDGCDTFGSNPGGNGICTLTFCGDGVLQNLNGIGQSEFCDDGNLLNGDGCSATCQVEIVRVCGDGNVDTPNDFGFNEQCDDGGANSDSTPNACRLDCTNPTCGDGVRDAGEECDGGRFCNAACENTIDFEEIFSFCGDGRVNSPNSQGQFEQCDDANGIPDDGCDACVIGPIGVCGDGTQNTNEQCDDGNLLNGDGCSSTCMLESSFCGDGNVDPFGFDGIPGNADDEECDNGVANSDSTPNACRTDCKNPGCGDGITDAGEECDGGLFCNAACEYNIANVFSFCGDGRVTNPNTYGFPEECDDANNVEGDGCHLCLIEDPAICGDGIRNDNEECDDGNLIDDDICSNACILNYPGCGNGILNPGETCDDGNNVDGDGCSQICQLEPGCYNIDVFSWPEVETGSCTKTFTQAGPNDYVFYQEECAESAYLSRVSQRYLDGDFTTKLDFSNIFINPAPNTDRKTVLASIVLEGDNSGTPEKIQFEITARGTGRYFEVAHYPNANNAGSLVESLYNWAGTPGEIVVRRTADRFDFLSADLDNPQVIHTINNAFTGVTKISLQEGHAEPQLQAIQGKQTSTRFSFFIDDTTIICSSNSCGDGILDVVEQCDDGNAANGDGCSQTCELEACLDEPNLVGQWKFSERATSRTAYDTSSNSNHGTLFNAFYTQGIINNGLYFDGLTSYVTVDPASEHTVQDLTMSTWASFDQVPQIGDIYTVFAVHEVQTPGPLNGLSSYNLMYENNDQFGTTQPHMTCSIQGLQAGVGTKYYLRYPVGDVSDLTHFACTYDNTLQQLRFYINGQDVTDASTLYENFALTPNINPAFQGTALVEETIYFGAYHAAGEVRADFHNGIIDEFTLWNTALDVNRILTLYNNGQGNDACVSNTCGNGVVEFPEQCDQGGATSTCSSTCQVLTCGNGIVDDYEQCDDGNLLNGDGCSVQCTLEQTCPYPEYPALLVGTSYYEGVATEVTPCPSGYIATSNVIALHEQDATQRPTVSNLTLCLQQTIPAGDIYLATTGFGRNSYVGTNNCGTDIELSKVTTYGCPTCTNNIDTYLCAKNPYTASLVGDQVAVTDATGIPDSQIQCSAPANTGVAPTVCLAHYQNELSGTCTNKVKICSGKNCGLCGNGIIDQGEECDAPLAPAFCTSTCQIPRNTVELANVCNIESICGVADGICPQDFYDTSLGAISCDGLRDIDCVRTSLSVLSQGNTSSFVESGEFTNTDGDISLLSQTIQDGNFVATFIVEGPTTAVSTTYINFSFNEPPTLVLFDNRVLLDCDIQQTTPCFYWFGNTLAINHPLSTHSIQVMFEGQNNYLAYVAIIVVLMMVPLLVVHMRRGSYLKELQVYTEQLEHHVHLPHEELDKLDTYIKRKQKKGMTKHQIKESLLAVGWEPHVVDLVMNHHHSPHEDVGRLKIYVHKMQEKKYSDAKIRMLLQSRGWDKKIVDKVMKK